MHLSHQNKMSRYKKEKNVRLLSCWKKREKKSRKRHSIKNSDERLINTRKGR